MNASAPVTVTVTGAAGQIGYALLFRDRQRRDARRRHAGRAPPARDPAGHAGARGRRDGAGGQRLPAAARGRGQRRSERGVRRVQHRPARGRATADEGHGARATCSRPTAPSSPRRAGAISENAADDVRVLVVGNPANTNCADRNEQRAGRAARALHRDDAPRPQSGAWRSSPSGRVRACATSAG